MRLPNQLSMAGRLSSYRAAPLQCRRALHLASFLVKSVHASPTTFWKATRSLRDIMLDQARNSTATQEGPTRSRMWFNSYATEASTGSDRKAADGHTCRSGFLTGGHIQLDENWLIGVAAGYGHATSWCVNGNRAFRELTYARWDGDGGDLCVRNGPSFSGRSGRI